MENSIFTKGSVKDADAILELIKKRIEWMDENNIEQWNKTDYLSFYPKEYFEEKAEAGQLYIMKNVISGRIVGAVVLLEEDERWRNDGSDSYYIHNLVSDTDLCGIGKEIIKSCEEMALRKGKERIRLDCQDTNIKLNDFYSKLGYEYVESFREGRYTGNKREKILIKN